MTKQLSWLVAYTVYPFYQWQWSYFSLMCFISYKNILYNYRWKRKSYLQTTIWSATVIRWKTLTKRLVDSAQRLSRSFSSPPDPLWKYFPKKTYTTWPELKSLKVIGFWQCVPSRLYPQQVFYIPALEGGLQTVAHRGCTLCLKLFPPLPFGQWGYSKTSHTHIFHCYFRQHM